MLLIVIYRFAEAVDITLEVSAELSDWIIPSKTIVTVNFTSIMLCIWICLPEFRGQILCY